MSAKPGKS